MRDIERVDAIFGGRIGYAETVEGFEGRKAERKAYIDLGKKNEYWVSMRPNRIGSLQHHLIKNQRWVTVHHEAEEDTAGTPLGHRVHIGLISTQSPMIESSRELRAEFGLPEKDHLAKLQHAEYDINDPYRFCLDAEGALDGRFLEQERYRKIEEGLNIPVEVSKNMHHALFASVMGTLAKRAVKHTVDPSTIPQLTPAILE